MLGKIPIIGATFTNEIKVDRAVNTPSLEDLALSDENIESLESLQRNIAIKLAITDSKKEEITKLNFERAMATIKTRPNGIWLAKQLSINLDQYIGEKLSPAEWIAKIEIAYGVIKAGNQNFEKNFPIVPIILDLIWALPGE